MKHLCALAKNGVKDHLGKITKAVVDPKYICMKCARVSNVKDRLCKPSKIKP